MSIFKGIYSIRTNNSNFDMLKKMIGFKSQNISNIIKKTKEMGIKYCYISGNGDHFEITTRTEEDCLYIKKLLYDLENSFTIKRFTLNVKHEKSIGILIGTGGKNLKELEEEYNVHISIKNNESDYFVIISGFESNIVFEHIQQRILKLDYQIDKQRERAEDNKLKDQIMNIIMINDDDGWNKEDKNKEDINKSKSDNDSDIDIDSDIDSDSKSESGSKSSNSKNSESKIEAFF